MALRDLFPFPAEPCANLAWANQDTEDMGVCCCNRNSRMCGHTLISHAGLLQWRSPRFPNAFDPPRFRIQFYVARVCV